MIATFRKQRMFRALATIAGAVHLTSCMSLHTAIEGGIATAGVIADRQAAAAEEPANTFAPQDSAGGFAMLDELSPRAGVLATLRDGTTIEMHRPTLVGSLVAYGHRSNPRNVAGMVALTDIVRLEGMDTNSFSPVAALAVVGGIGVTLYFVAAMSDFAKGMNKTFDSTCFMPCY